MLVKNELLGYPRIEIFQDTELFSFNTDSILLASFVRINNKTKKIVDLGSGNGSIPLYLSLRTNMPITAVEVQENVFNLLKMNIEHNQLQSQITPVCHNVKGISDVIGFQAFDVVISNPPFFKKHEHSKTNEHESVTIARHEVLITLDEWINEASKLLNHGGVFYMVHRPDRLSEIMVSLNNYHLEPKRIRFVQPHRNKKPNHVLIEAVKMGLPGGLDVMKPLILKNKDKWTKEVLEIYHIGSDSYATKPTKP